MNQRTFSSNQSCPRCDGGADHFQLFAISSPGSTIIFAFTHSPFASLREKILKLNWSSIKATAIRLQPGEDLKIELAKLVKENQLQAASILSAVGSLSKVSLRLANRNDSKDYFGKHEIVSMTGTLCQEGLHLHMTVSNSDGYTFGGHLIDGSTIFTTAEIVIAELPDLVFNREPCPKSGFLELVINQK